MDSYTNLIYGDCKEELKKLLDNSINLTITSPPYDNIRNYDNTLEWGENIWKSIIFDLYRITVESGVVVWIVGDAVIDRSETGSSFKQALYAMECGFKLHDTMIYQKNSSTFPASKNSNRYTQIFEYMFILSKGTPKAKLICDKKNKWAGHKDFSGKLKNPVPKFSPRNNIWKYTTSFNGVKHPAPFPEKLAEDHIRTWSKEGDIILDPFMGSGTTGKLAKVLNRSFIGIEKVEKYFKIAEKRVRNVL